MAADIVVGSWLYWTKRFTIRDTEWFRAFILENEHDSKVGGHLDIDEIIKLVQRNFSSSHMTDCITCYIQSCNECQHNNLVRHKKYGLLQPLESPCALWESIPTDFIVQLPESKENKQICMVVNHFTKIAHDIPLRQCATPSDMACVF